MGKTFEGRDIIALQFESAGYAKKRPAAVIFGAIHGDEPLGVSCIEKLAADLVEQPPGRETWLIPALNIDGLMAGTKNNARDVDLNRNFASKNWSNDHKPGYFPGANPESEPETQALARLIEEVSATRLLALHSPFRTVNWDGSGEELAIEMGERTGYGASSDIGYPTPGSFGSKYGADLQSEVITLEIPWMTEEEAWKDIRGALRFSVELPDLMAS